MIPKSARFSDKITRKIKSVDNEPLAEGDRRAEMLRPEPKHRRLPPGSLLNANVGISALMSSRLDMQHDTVPTAPALQRATLLVLLVALTGLSQFYRVANSVIGPELVRDLGLTAQELGWAGGAFFAALFVMQIPVGIAFDRVGARVTVAVLSVAAAVGAILAAQAESAGGLVAARTVIGIGCAASFMSAVFLCSRWFPPDRLATVLSWVFAASNLGTLMAATPLAFAQATVGWRNAFLLLAGVTIVAAVLFYALVRDRPPGESGRTTRPEPLADIVKGLVAVWRTPGLIPILAIHTFAYASMVTVLGVWAGPYLNDVHGVGGVARGNIILAMGVAQSLGILCYGPLDRLVGNRKRVVVLGALLSIAALVALGLVPRPPLWLAIALMVTLCFVASYAVVIVAQGRALFDAHQAGRGVTTVNMAQVVGAMLLPVLTGAVIGFFAPVAGVLPEIAFRAVFLTIAACLVAGLAVYSRSPGTPRP
jgi:predicted MFS family arabinose efflux permease